MNSEVRQCHSVQCNIQTERGTLLSVLKPIYSIKNKKEKKGREREIEDRELLYLIVSSCPCQAVLMAPCSWTIGSRTAANIAHHTPWGNKATAMTGEQSYRRGGVGNRAAAMLVKGTRLQPWPHTLYREQSCSHGSVKNRVAAMAVKGTVLKHASLMSKAKGCQRTEQSYSLPAKTAERTELQPWQQSEHRFLATYMTERLT